MLLIGQSNMAGRGLPNEVDPIADGRIETFRDYQWKAAVEPLHNDKKTAGVGRVGRTGRSGLVVIVDREVESLGGRQGRHHDHDPPW